MMTVGELLEQAQRQSWDLVRPLSVPGQRPSVVARDLVREQLAGWPDLARAGDRALRATAGGGRSARYEPALTVLRAVASRRLESSADESPFAGLCLVLGAAADLMHAPESRTGLLDGDLDACRDKIAAVLETVARTTAGYAELTSLKNQEGFGHRRRELEDLAGSLQAAMVTRPGHRAGSLDDLGVPNPGSDLQCSVAAWRRSVEDHLRPGVAAGSPHVLHAVAVAAAFTSRSVAASFSAASEAGAVDPGAGAHAAASFATAAMTWRAAAVHWHDLRGGPSPPAEHLAIDAALRAAIREQFHSPQGWLSGREICDGRSLADLAQLAGEARWISAQLSAAVAPCADVTRILVEHGAVLAPRPAVRHAVKEASTSKRWVELPRGEYIPIPSGAAVPVVQDLLAATKTAVDATNRAVGAGQVTARWSSPEWPPGTQYAAAVGRRPAGYFAAHPGVAASFPAPNGQAPQQAATPKPRTAPRSGQPAAEVER